MAKPECITCVWAKMSNVVLDYTKSNREWSDEIGVSEASIRRHFKHAPAPAPRSVREETPANARWDVSDTEFDGSSPASDKPLTVDDVRNFIIGKGLNPDEWDYQWKFSEWEQFSKMNGLRTLNAFKVWGKRVKVEPLAFTLDELPDAIANFKWNARESDAVPRGGGSLIVLATDFQLGKTDWNGGTDETVAQVLNSFRNVRHMAEEHEVDEIVVVDAGDIIENFYNTSSQRQTNDRSLPSQVLAATQLMLAGLAHLAESGRKLKYVAVPSNHGRDRLGMQAAAGDVHDDWGIVVAELIRMTTNVEVIIPEKYHESVAFLTSNTGIGVVHGHQAGGPDKIGDWWKGQSHGEMPVTNADILVTGHWHSLRAQQSGNKKWIIVGSASDRGSSWFTNTRGESSVSGITCFVTADGKWNDLRIV
jgi:hypothetical protein